MGSAVGIKICAIAIVIKKYKLISKKMKKTYNKINLNLKRTKFLISKALTNLCISHNEFVSVNIVWKRIWCYKRKYQNSKNFMSLIKDFNLFIKQCFLNVWSVKKIQNEPKTKNGRIILL